MLSKKSRTGVVTCKEREIVLGAKGKYALVVSNNATTVLLREIGVYLLLLLLLLLFLLLLWEIGVYLLLLLLLWESRDPLLSRSVFGRVILPGDYSGQGV